MTSNSTRISGILLLLLFVAVLLLASSCTKESDEKVNLNIMEKEVVITAVSPSSQDVSTRTIADADGVQVYWNTDEHIKIFTTLNPAGVDFRSTNEEASLEADFTGTIAVSDPNEGSEEPSTIYGLYPFIEGATCDQENGTITTTLPDEQTGRAGSYADETLITIGRSTSFVMGFYHVCSGFKFQVTREDIQSVELSGNNNEPLAGTFTAGWDEETKLPILISVGTPKTTVTLTAPEDDNDGFFRTDTWYYIVTLPVSFENGFTLTARTPTKYGSWSTSKAASFQRARFDKKSNLCNGMTMHGTDYFIASIDNISAGAYSSSYTVTVTSTTTPEGGEPEGSGWSTSFSTDGGTTWSSTAPDWLSLSATSGSGSTAGESVNFKLNTIAGSSFTENFGSESTTLRETPSVSTDATAPRDLCLYDIHGSRKDDENNDYDAETANCYVVRAPGYYMFPLVYGNGIKGGVTNTISSNGNAIYAPGVTGNYVLPKFKNSNGADIQSSYILEDLELNETPVTNLDAVVVWQDVAKGYEIILDSDVEVIDHTDVTSNALECKYIRFYISPDNIKSGNVMIALRDKDNSNQILWSWHIWVSGYEFTTTQLASDEILNVNLGWSQPLTFDPVSISRSCTVKVSSTAVPSVCRTFTVSQSGSLDGAEGGTAYSGTYYQWGRKDPFLPSKGSTTSNKPSTSSSGYTITNGTQGVATMKISGNGTIKNQIQTPYKHQGGDMPAYYNTWDATQTGTGSRAVVKTIYDPCPRGYRVPRRNFANGFTSSYRSSGSVDGVDGYYFTQYTPNVFFPFTGGRANDTGILSQMTEGYYRSATVNSAQQATCILYITKSNGYVGANYAGTPISYRSQSYPVRPAKDK